jgi:F0F1-type ATP synthase assembly protein I
VAFAASRARGSLQPPKPHRYDVTAQSPENGRGGDRKKGSSASAESVAFLLLGGVVTGLGVGAGIDWLVKTFPLFTVVGVFAGFALALYAIHLETK